LFIRFGEGVFLIMLKVSLIVATLGERPFDLCALLRSLEPQAKFIKQVIIVDQHPDHRRVPGLISAFSESLPIVHTRSERGLSRARNHGLLLVKGDLVAFPDDDCLYPDGLLEWVVDWFETNYEYDILAVGANDADGTMSGNRWIQSACDIRPINAFRTTFSPSLFLCTDLAQSTRFDEQLGVGSGTPYGSGEETDYVLRLLRRRARGRFDRTRHIIHPRRDMLSGTVSGPRALAYGIGMGHVLRINSLTCLWLGFLAYNLARAFAAGLRWQLKGAHFCVAQALGIWKGFISPVAQGKRVLASTRNHHGQRPSLVRYGLPPQALGIPGVQLNGRSIGADLRRSEVLNYASETPISQSGSVSR
jgi:glycosyltransferase involved in cell wall biosynthesis